MDVVEWKAGMVVAFRQGHRSGLEKRIISRVTPSGIAVIAGASPGTERKFGDRGYERGTSYGYNGRPRIEPWGPQHDDEIAQRRRESMQYLLRAAMGDLDAYSLDEIKSEIEALRAARIAAKNTRDEDKGTASAVEP